MLHSNSNAYSDPRDTQWDRLLSLAADVGRRAVIAVGVTLIILAWSLAVLDLFVPADHGESQLCRFVACDRP